jgi:predicted metal-dependent HD superfamily phosphohydrolase
MNTPLQDPDALLARASVFVYTLFKEKLPETIRYHTFQHTVDVAREAARIGRKAGLDDEEQLLVTLAAWFHDTGFTETYEGHEEAGVRIATAYLEEEGFDPDEIEAVAAFIRSTHTDREPVSVPEEVLHDADLAHVGKRRKFFEMSDRLRKEWEVHRGVQYTDQEWAEVQLHFLSRVRYRTKPALRRFDAGKRDNLLRVQQQLAGLLGAPAPAADGREEAGQEAPGRGIETMFRTNYRTHINLSAIADSKANIMISVNAILMSILVSFVSTRLQADPWLMIPATTMLITSLVAIVFAILSARPKVTSEVFTLDEIRQNQSNILFFGNFVNLGLREFNVGMKEVMADKDRLYDSMIHDLYSLGQVLSKKYRLLWLSYTVFMAGLVLAVALFLTLFFVG